MNLAIHSNAAWQIWYLRRVWDLELNIWSTSAGLKYAWLGCKIIDSSGSWRSRGMKQLSRTGSLSCILTTKEQMLLTGTCVWTVRSSLVCRLFRAGLANSRALRAIYCRREEVPVSSTRERLPQSRSCVPLIKELNPRSQVGTLVKELSPSSGKCSWSNQELAKEKKINS